MKQQQAIVTPNEFADIDMQLDKDIPFVSARVKYTIESILEYKLRGAILRKIDQEKVNEILNIPIIELFDEEMAGLP